MKNKVKVVINKQGVKRLESSAGIAMQQAMTDVRNDLLSSQTLPYLTGATQEATELNSKDANKGSIYLVSDVTYAEENYFANRLFSRSVNTSAGPRWFEPYLSGGKRKLPITRFAFYYRKLTK